MEEEVVGRHHESARALRDCEGQGGLACCSPQDCKESDRTERLNNHSSNI